MASRGFKIAIATFGAAMLLTSGCAPSADSTLPAPSPSPTPTGLLDPIASVEVDSNIQLCDVDAVVPDSEFEELGAVVYRDPNLTLTRDGFDLKWVKDGASGVAFQHPEPELLSGQENPYTSVVVEDNWVLFNVFGLSAADGSVALYLWDASHPEQPAKRLSSSDRVDTRGGSVAKRIAGNYVVWTEWPTLEKGIVVLHDLSTGETRDLAETTGAYAAMLDEDTVVWQTAGATEDTYTLTGLVLSSNQTWTPPAEFEQLFTGFWGFSAFEGNWVFELYPQSETGEPGAYVMLAWPKGAAAPYELSRTLSEGVSDAADGAGQGYYSLVEPAGENVFTYLVDLSRGIRFKVRDGWAQVEVRNDQVVLTIANEATVSELKQATVPLSDFEQRSC